MGLASIHRSLHHSKFNLPTLHPSHHHLHLQRMPRLLQALWMLLLCSSVAGFTSRRFVSSTASKLSVARRPYATATPTTTTMMSTALSKRPNVYVYDHCPFCVRARMIFGLKQVPHQLIFLDNDDVETPTSLVGKKVVPILEMTDAEGKMVVMPESMDIVKRVDEDSRWGPPLLKPATNREDIKAFFESIADLSRRCTRPRFALSSVLPEFHTPAARAAFVKNHPFKSAPFDYTENLMNTKLVSDLSEKLKELDGLIFSADCVTEGGVGYDDIDLFGKTRGLTVVNGLVLPPKLKAYLERMAEKTEIPLYHQMEL